MTIKIYHDDSYLKKIQAVVTSLDKANHGIILDRTIFYPGGGGQPADRGKIASDDSVFSHVQSKMISGQLVHLIMDNDPLPDPGAAVKAELDWDYRYKLMRTHTAMHILCGVIFRDFGASVTGGSMDPLQGRMDFEFASLHKDLVAIIEQAVNAEVKKSLPVSWRQVPREEALKIPDLIRTKINLVPEHIPQIRVVEIQSLDLQADGGTHVRNTSEVREVRIVDYKSKGKENKRIYLALAE
jgi:misacylated tRNA(Ala) deacylase